MFAAALAGALQLSVLFGQVASTPPTMEEIAAAIARLGDDSFEVRQKATEWLWQAGAVVEPQLRAALKSTDPEIRTRAASVLDKVRFGLRPDTPADIAALIDQFRHSGAQASRQQALAGLQAKGQWAIVLTLLRGETDPAQRRALASAISADAGKLLRPLLEQGDLDQAEQVLELTAMNETGLAQLAAFLLLTERLEPRIEALRQKLAAESQDDDWRRLAIFLRAKGDFSAAADAAAKTTDLVFASNVLAEAGRFAEAAKLADEVGKLNKSLPEAQAFAAAYYHQIGDEAQFQRLHEVLRQAASIDKLGDKPQPAVPVDPFGQQATSPQSTHAWRLAETLLVTEHIDEALAVLKKTHPHYAHALLVRQHRHRDALDFVGVTAGQALDRKWLDALPAGLGDIQQQLTVRFNLAAQVARQLRELGQPQQVQQILDTLRTVAAADSQRGMRWTALAALEWQLDRYDECFADAEQALAANQGAATVFTAIVKKQGGLAATWFGELTNRDPLADRKAAIAQAVWLVVTQPPAGKVPANWRDLVQASADQARKLAPPERGARLMLPAEICRARGDMALARKLYEEAEEGYPFATLKAGDAAAADGDWKTAAEKYGKLAAGDGSDPSYNLYVYLHAIALTKSGDAEAGAKKLRLATLTALAPDGRYRLALGLQERELKPEAAEQFELARRTGLPDSSYSVWSAQQVGNLVSGQDPQRAADCWRQLHLHILNSASNFVESEGYLSLPQIIHKMRAKVALAAGQAAALQTELDLCEKVLPGDVRLVTDLVPKLDAAGQKAAADKLFERGLAGHHRVLDEFPESPSFLNNAAWICARAQRQLDEGLALAQRALKVAPDEASYHDTLAEIHFQRGDRDAAVAASRRAAELSPDNKLFTTRLAHFQNDAVKTLDAANE